MARRVPWTKHCSIAKEIFEGVLTSCRHCEKPIRDGSKSVVVRTLKNVVLVARFCSFSCAFKYREIWRRKS